MNRDTSPKGRVALAEKLWQLARTDPSDLAEEMHTNSLAVEILRAGLDLYIQQVQSSSNIPGDELETVHSMGWE